MGTLFKRAGVESYWQPLRRITHFESYCIRAELFFPAPPDAGKIVVGTPRDRPFAEPIRPPLPNCAIRGCCSVTITAVAGTFPLQA
jgi:hypothetical protein